MGKKILEGTFRKGGKKGSEGEEGGKAVKREGGERAEGR